MVVSLEKRSALYGRGRGRCKCGMREPRSKGDPRKALKDTERVVHEKKYRKSRKEVGHWTRASALALRAACGGRFRSTRLPNLTRLAKGPTPFMMRYALGLSS
jgi:hypothetical protein